MRTLLRTVWAPRALAAWLAGAILATSVPSFGQQAKVTARIEIVGNKSVHHPDLSNVAVWLIPTGDVKIKDEPAHPQPQQLTQKHKSFSPHLLIVQIGSYVEFPNHDPFFHNVFSLFDGKRFDLGLYEAGTSRALQFDRVGVCYIFCNIHSEMSAVILVVNTPYYGISNSKGEIAIPNVPPGVYQMKVWDERASTQTLDSFTRKVTISEASTSLGVLQIAEQPNVTMTHKNKYGQDYETPAPDNPLYTHP